MQGLNRGQFFSYKIHQFPDITPAEVKLDACRLIDLRYGSHVPQFKSIPVSFQPLLFILPEVSPNRNGPQLRHTVFDIVEGHFIQMKLFLP